MNNFSFPLRADSRLQLLLATGALLTATLALLIVTFLANESWPLLRGTGWHRFFVDDGWYPLEERYGLMPMVWATLLATVGAIALAGPLGLIGAIFACYFAPPRLAALYRSAIALMAGIPSVVYGFWGLLVLVPLITRLAPPGASLLAAIIILAMMVLPTIALLCDAAMQSVPRGFLNAAAALGLSRTGTVLRVVLPAIRGTVVASILLGAGRAIGETMAVIMVAGNIVQIPTSVFDPVRVLTANIAMEMAYATGTHRSSLFVSGVILSVMIALLGLLALWAKRGGHGD